MFGKICYWQLLRVEMAIFGFSVAAFDQWLFQTRNSIFKSVHVPHRRFLCFSYPSIRSFQFLLWAIVGISDESLAAWANWELYLSKKSRPSGSRVGTTFLYTEHEAMRGWTTFTATSIFLPCSRLPYRKNGTPFLHGLTFPLMLSWRCLWALKLPQDHRPFVEVTLPMVSLEKKMNSSKPVIPTCLISQCKEVVDVIYCWSLGLASLPSSQERK